MSEDQTEGDQYVLNRCYRFLSYRPRTTAEVIRFLKKRVRSSTLTEEKILKIVSKLTQQHLLNDVEFITWFVEQRSAKRIKSSWLLSKELKQLGINETLIEDFFSTHPQDSVSLALSFLQSRKTSLSLLSDKQLLYKKGLSLLLRRGFTFSDANNALGSFIAELSHS